MAEEKPSLTAAYVAEALGATLEGDGTVQLDEFSGIRGARAGSLSFVSDKRSSKIAAKSPVAALIAPEGFELKSMPKAVIRVKDLAAACEKAATLFSKPAPVYSPGIHPTAVIGKGVTLGKDVIIGPCAVIEESSSVGDGTKLGAHVHLEPGVQVGRNCDIQGGVKVRYNCVIGDRVSLLPGVVIGGDGFGYTFKDGVHQKVPQIGNVIIEDDVEIGSNTTVDRARFGSTRIGRGTKIDNLVMIAHNVQIGSHCILTAQVGVAGSTTIGDYVIIGAQTGIVGHITIGSNTMIGAGSGVTKDIPPNSTIMGIPADNRPQAVRALMAVKKLPEMLIEMRGLKKIIKEHLRGDSETTTNN